mgnify:CR=1 FL=1
MRRGILRRTATPAGRRTSSTIYVECANRPRISRRSARFFLDWVEERMGRVKLENPGQRDQVLKYHRAAREFWKHLVDSAAVE